VNKQLTYTQKIERAKWNIELLEAIERLPQGLDLDQQLNLAALRFYLKALENATC